VTVFITRNSGIYMIRTFSCNVFDFFNP